MTDVPWHRQHPEEARRVAAEIEREQPGLHLVERDEQLVLIGEFQIREAGRVIDAYEIEVTVPRDGPQSALPKVREVGGRIPRTLARHMNCHDGTACVGVPDQIWYENPDGMGLVEFLRGPVLAYFVGQSMVDRGEPWPYGERAHGFSGIAEFYAPLLGMSDLGQVRRVLRVLANEEIRLEAECPCGGGRALQECHFDILQRLRSRIPRTVLLASSQAL